jgi:LruC domain-containing protein
VKTNFNLLRKRKYTYLYFLINLYMKNNYSVNVIYKERFGKTFKIINLLLIVLVLNACKRDFSALNNIRSMDDLVIPSGFKWENSRDVNFNIAINDLKFLDDLHLISIYDKDPALGGELLAKGSATSLSPFLTTIYLASTIKEVYIVKTAPDNTKFGQKVEAKSKDIKLTVTSSSIKKVASINKTMSISANDLAIKITEADCNVGCTQIITTNNTNLNVNNGDVICVTADNITIGFNANGGTIKICGKNVTIQNATLNNSAKLIVSTSGSIILNSLNMNGQSSALENHGTISLNGSFSTGGSVSNFGNINVKGDFNLNSGSQFINYETLKVTSSFTINTVNEVKNYGSIDITSNFQINSNANFTNYCKVLVVADFINNSKLNNYSYIKVNKKSTVNSNAASSFYDESMLSTSDMTINGNVNGSGGVSLIKVLKNSIINSSGIVKGQLQYCDENGIETNNGKFTDGAIRSCSVYIPRSECNTEGNGIAAIIDTDNDGISDLLDEYPDDPTKAFNNYYPSGSSDGKATLAFEDNWPKKGDYDLNDVVISYQYKIVTNAENKVVQVHGDFYLNATGGGFYNGFGVEFPLKTSQAKNVVGGVLEAGQENAVIILFTNMRQEMENWNTKPGNPTSAPIRYQISFDDMSGTSLKDFGLGVYNPFIWNGSNGFGRGHEVHLPGMKPTSLADQSLLGKDDDDSEVSLNRYYLTSNGLPWGINIPVNSFDYPNEMSNIFRAYLKFPGWAQSGGTKFTDWYVNKSDGYRNNDHIYK